MLVGYAIVLNSSTANSVLICISGIQSAASVSNHFYNYSVPNCPKFLPEDTRPIILFPGVLSESPCI
jgi:hypothetical protein